MSDQKILEEKKYEHTLLLLVFIVPVFVFDDEDEPPLAPIRSNTLFFDVVCDISDGLIEIIHLNF